MIYYRETQEWKDQVKDNMALISERKERIRNHLKIERDTGITKRNNHIIDAVRKYNSDDYVDWLKRLEQ